MNRLKNKVIIFLSIYMTIFIFTTSSFATTSFVPCLNLVEQIISPKPKPKLLKINLSDLNILEKLGSGTDAEVFKVKYKNNEYIFRNPYYLSQSAYNSYSLLNPEELKTLRQIDLTNAEEIIEKMSKKEILNDNELRSHAIADTIVNFYNQTKINNLYFEGKPISPKMIALVENKNGVIVGQLMELISGTDMATLIKQKKLTQKMYQQIYEHILAQIKILHENSFAHGDLWYQNIMVDFSSNNDIDSVRLIDFNIYYKRDSLQKTMSRDLHNLKEFKKNASLFYKLE